MQTQLPRSRVLRKAFDSRFSLQIKKVFAKTVEDGARTQIDCSLNPEYDDFEKFSGLYWADVKPAESSDYGKDMVLAGKLWELTERNLAQRVKSKA